MVLLRIACMGLVVLFTAEARADQAKDTRDEYEARKAKLGRGSSAQVDLALWCEAHGLSVERTKHLALAVLNDSNNALARSLMGLVSYQGRWESPDKLRDKVQADETLNRKLAEYNARREALEARDRKALLTNAEAAEKRGQLDVAERLRRRYVSMVAPEHVKLGLWCEQNGLKAEAAAHFTQAVVLDPYDDATWKHLGYIKRDGRWISRAQAETERAEADRLRKAERYYEPLLRKYRDALRGKDEAKADEARALLAEITDPLALTSVWRVFGIEREADQLTVVEMLGRMDSATATRRLAGLALYGKSITVREAAAKALRGREPRDYASEVIEHIHAPMTYQVEPVQGPGAPGALLVETPRFKMLRTYDAPPVFTLSNQFYGYVGYDPNGLPVVARGVELRRMDKEGPVKRADDLAGIEARTSQMIAEANIKAVTSQQRLIADVYAIESENAEARTINPLAAEVLRTTLDAPATLKDDDENGWRTWWFDKLGYRYDSPTQVTLQVNASPQLAPPRVYSCFAAGTPVRTLNGHKPIEQIRVGDQLLAQDATTGALGVCAVTVVHHNAPSPTIAIALDNDETLTASVYHRFWRAGAGWVMARDLKPGDVLRTIGGVSKVVKTRNGPVVPVFNLDVASAHTFFVGTIDTLVHDNTLPDPHAKAFDRIGQ